MTTARLSEPISRLRSTRRSTRKPTANGPRGLRGGWATAAGAACRASVFGDLRAGWLPMSATVIAVTTSTIVAAAIASLLE